MSKLHDALDPPAAPEAGADPFVDGLVEQTAARHAALIEPAELAEIKDELRLFLTAHPRAGRIVDRARPHADRRRSGDEEVAELPDAPGVDDKAGGASR
jgi:hypothetical protein